MDALIQQAVSGMRANGFEVAEVRHGHGGARLSARPHRAGQIRRCGRLGKRAGYRRAARPGSSRAAKYTPAGAQKPEDIPTIRQNSRTADVYLCSANAVTRAGKLVLVDGLGNRVGAVCDGPREVFFVISHSKVVGRRHQYRRGPHQKNGLPAEHAPPWD